MATTTKSILFICEFRIYLKLTIYFSIYRYTIREQILDDGMVSELGISHTYRHDTGMYICQASNSFGQVIYIRIELQTKTKK